MARREPPPSGAPALRRSHGSHPPRGDNSERGAGGGQGVRGVAALRDALQDAWVLTHGLKESGMLIGFRWYIGFNGCLGVEHGGFLNNKPNNTVQSSIFNII